MGFRILFLILSGLISNISTLPVCHSSKTFLLDYVFFGSFIQMPEDPMKNILEYLDFHDIRVLREDDAKPATHLTSVSITLFSDLIGFSLESQARNEIRIYYEKFNEGCLVKKWHGSEEIKRTIVENEDFVTVFSRDFDIFLRHQKTVLEEFRIYFNYLDSTINERVLESVNKSFKSMKYPLQVKSMHMEVNNHNEILSILPYIDPKPLEKIEIYEPLERDDAVLNLDEIGQLEQWKQADKVWIDGFEITNLGQNIKYCSMVKISFAEVSIEELLLLKEIFLYSSTLNVIELVGTDILIDGLIEAFGEPFLDTDQNENWFFRIPLTNQFLVIQYAEEIDHFVHRDRFIHFNRIEKSDVPQNAKIQN